MFSRITNIFVFFVFATGLFMIDCTGAKVPKDFPKTLPYTITVVSAGKPIEVAKGKNQETIDVGK